jgi:acetyltransferase-like isoleucine patch superfamily enzyme
MPRNIPHTVRRLYYQLPNKREQGFGALYTFLLLWPLGSKHLRSALLAALGLDVSRSARLERGISIQGKNLHIADRAYINAQVFIDTRGASVTVEHAVHIGPRCSILTSTHEIGPHAQRAGHGEGKAVVICSGAWLGAGTVICPGVTVGHGSIIAAGSVVTHDVDENILVAGVPARMLRHLP